MVRSRALIVVSVFLLSALAAAGCVTSGGDLSTSEAAPSPTDWAKKAVAFGDGHDHRKWDQHVGLSSPNFQELAYDPLPTQYYDNKTAVGYFCGGTATAKDGHKFTVISSYDSDVAFVLVDVTDPLKPMKVGEYVLKGTTHYDVDITPDAQWVLIGSDPNLSPRVGTADVAAAELGLPTGGVVPTMTVQPVWRDACTGEERNAGPESQIPIAPATLLISIKDPRNPTFADAAPAPVMGPHSVSTATINGNTYVASSITNLAHHASYFQFFQILDTPLGGRLVLQSMVDSGMYGKQVLDPSQGPFSEFSNGHVDAEIALHPATKKPVVYLSDWDGGLIILDFSDPAAPTQLSQWIDSGPQGGNVHSTRSIGELWDGKHYVLVGQEFVSRPVNRPSGWLYIIDDTDPTKPQEVGRWTLPIDSEAHWNGKVDGLETYSTHYFRVVNRTLFMAMYHIGVWAIDLSTSEKLVSPPSVGVFVPDKAPPAPRREPKGGYDLTPFVLDVFPNPDYTMTIFDGYSGVYSVKYDPDHPMISPTPWPASGKAHEDG
ncbi:MAG: hypothetical protein WDA16_06750 [Candidatus Thermoplasmatota archaeon]